MRGLALLLVVAAVGCNDGTKAGPAPEPQRADASPKQSESKPATVPEPEPVVQKKPGHNEARIYQVYDLKKTQITIGKHKFSAWIMDDEPRRTEGMMFLTNKEVKDNEGMIFVFSDERDRSFWMHNTLIDLDIAYIRKDGTIVSVSKMKALDESGVPSNGPAMYAFEVKGGVFGKLGIRAGMKATFNPKPISKD